MCFDVWDGVEWRTAQTRPEFSTKFSATRPVLASVVFGQRLFSSLKKTRIKYRDAMFL